MDKLERLKQDFLNKTEGWTLEYSTGKIELWNPTDSRKNTLNKTLNVLKDLLNNYNLNYQPTHGGFQGKGYKVFLKEII